MTTLETIQALAMQGIGKDGIEATIGHEMDDTERKAFHKAKTARRIKRAASAKAEKKRNREEEECKAREGIDALMDGTSWPDERGDTLKPMSATERSRAFRARGRDIGVIPPPRHRRVRESCRLDPLRFGLLYCVDEYEGMKPLLMSPGLTDSTLPSVQ